ncbi:MAG: M15 family metallopeptidase [Verrucomicrobiota bacterium]
MKKYYRLQIPRVCAFIVLVIFSAPLLSTGQLFRKQSALARKAKPYLLVPAKEAIPGIEVELRYKTTSAAGKPLYLPSMPCLIHQSTAVKLKRANEAMKKHGYRIKIWDAWRPPEAHIALWEAVRDPNYVVPPSKGLSWHCYGVSVDITLVTLNGAAVTMPTDFDVFSSDASSTYSGADAAIANRIALLQTAMRDAGFRTIRSEWWHFDDMSPRGGFRNVTAKDLGIKMP